MGIEERDATPARAASQTSQEVLGDVPVALRPPVPIELPMGAHLVDEVEVEVGGHELILLAAADGQDLPVGIAELGSAVELAEVPGRFPPHAVVGPHEVAV